MSNFTESNRARIVAIPEASNNWGETPASGISKEMRITSSSLAASKETAISEELRADRMTSSIIETAASSAGDISFEMSSGTIDDFLSAFLLSGWSTPNGAEQQNFSIIRGNVTVASATSLVVVGDVTDKFNTNTWLKIEGMLTASNNKYVKATNVAFASGVTTFTFPASTFVVETNTTLAKSRRKIIEANDVIVSSNAIRTGTGGASSFDSNGGNLFANADLKVGQKIFVDGDGYGSQTVTFSGVPADGSTVTIGDGVKTVTFECDTDSVIVSGNKSFAPGGTVTTAAVNLVAAINASYGEGDFLVTATNVAGVVTITNRRAESGSITKVGANITVGGATFTGNDKSQHGYFTITAFDDDSITVDRQPTTKTAGTIIVIKGSSVSNAGNPDDIVSQSFTVETGFTDTNQYFVQRGMRVGSFGLNVAAGEIVNGTLNFQGRDTVPYGTSVLANAPYTLQGTTSTEVFNATENVGSIEKDGQSLATAIQSIEINGEAGLREQRAVGNKFAAGIGTGRFNLSGSFTSYFENLEMYNDFINHTTISLGFNMTDNDGNTYWFTIPALKLTSDPIAPGGIDQDIMETIEWTAFRDEVSNTQFIIDRFSSTRPKSN